MRECGNRRGRSSFLFAMTDHAYVGPYDVDSCLSGHDDESLKSALLFNELVYLITITYPVNDPFRIFKSGFRERVHLPKSWLGYRRVKRPGFNYDERGW